MSVIKGVEGVPPAILLQIQTGLQKGILPNQLRQRLTEQHLNAMSTRKIFPRAKNYSGSVDDVDA